MHENVTSLSYVTFCFVIRSSTVMIECCKELLGM